MTIELTAGRREKGVPRVAGRSGIVTHREGGVRAALRFALTPLQVFVSFLGAALTWELLRWLGILPTLYFPSILGVLQDFAAGLAEGPQGPLIQATLSSLATWAVAFLLAATIGLTGGMLIGSSAHAAAALAPLLRFARSTPAVALIPVAILLAGIGGVSKILIVVFAGVWPVLLNTSSGIRHVPRQYLDTARTVGMAHPDIVRRVVLPSISPAVVTGLRVSMSLTLAVTIGVDLLIGNSGLGALIAQYQAVGNTAGAYSGILLAGLLGTGLIMVLNGIERRIMFWSPEFRTR